MYLKNCIIDAENFIENYRIGKIYAQLCSLQHLKITLCIFIKNILYIKNYQITMYICNVILS